MKDPTELTVGASSAGLEFYCGRLRHLFSPARACHCARGRSPLAALLRRFVELEWLVRAPKPVVKVTDAGWAALAERLGVEVDGCR